MRSKNLQSLVAGATFAALNTLQVTGHINVGGEPNGLAWAIRP
jgi:hypothetical protein